MSFNFNIRLRKIDYLSALTCSPEREARSFHIWPILSAHIFHFIIPYLSVFQSRVQSFLQTFEDFLTTTMLIYLFRRVLMQLYKMHFLPGSF